MLTYNFDFLDGEKNMVRVNAEFYNDGISIICECAYWMGQCFDRIAPNTEGQKELIEFVNTYREKIGEKTNMDLYEEFGNIVEKIKDEEEERKDALEYDDDAIQDYIENEGGFCDCDAVFALVSYLGLGMSEVDDISEDSDNVYSVHSETYYVGTQEELEKLALDWIVDERYLWVDAVQAGHTDLGLEEWAQYVVDNDGVGNVLGGYDGVENWEGDYIIIRQ